MSAGSISPVLLASPGSPAPFVPVHLQVYGEVGSPALRQLVTCVQSLYLARSHLLAEPPQVFPLYQAEWTEFVHNLRRVVQGGELWCLSAPAVLFCDSQYVGGPEQAQDWVTDTFDLTFGLDDDIESAGTIYLDTLLSRQRSVVYLELSHDDEPLGRLVFELYDQLVPRACLNFRQLCWGGRGVSEAGTLLWYAGSPVHRIVPGGWIQAGDIVDGSGAHGESVLGASFADECFAVPHDRRGRLAMVQDRRNASGSQFSVALQPMLYMQSMSCAFGQLVEGSALLDYLETVETVCERPVRPVIITDAGVLFEPSVARSPPQPASPHSPAADEAGVTSPLRAGSQVLKTGPVIESLRELDIADELEAEDESLPTSGAQETHTTEEDPSNAEEESLLSSGAQEEDAIREEPSHAEEESLLSSEAQEEGATGQDPSKAEEENLLSSRGTQEKNTPVVNPTDAEEESFPHGEGQEADVPKEQSRDHEEENLPESVAQNSDVKEEISRDQEDGSLS